MMGPTPRSLGYRMPAEWEPQEAIWLAWPHNAETWPGRALAEVRERFVEIARLLHTGQRVKILVGDVTVEEAAKRQLAGAGVALESVDFFRVPNEDAWIRDYGPTFLVGAGSELAMVKWRFNAWGGKYADLQRDDGVVARLNAELGLVVFEAGIVLEGGSIDVNGRGAILTTEQCLLHPNRNPGLTREDLERCLGEHLNATEVVWLGEGIAGDDTDGHVDDIARFVDERTVVCAFEEDPRDPNHPPLKDNYDRLTRHRDREGRGLNVVKLPMPGPIEEDGQRLPASYANFYIGNRVVIAPVFGDPSDARALSILRECFPRRTVAGVDCRAMVLGMGAVHCCSQQEPSVREPRSRSAPGPPG